jgi:hypothetical protein
MAEAMSAEEARELADSDPYAHQGIRGGQGSGGVSPRSMIIATIIVLVALWFNSDFDENLLALVFDHGDAVVLWGIVGAVIWHLRDE